MSNRDTELGQIASELNAARPMQAQAIREKDAQIADLRKQLGERERDARHWLEECGKVHAKADIMEDRWRTAESKLAAAREALEKIASGTVYNPSKLAADSLAQLRDSGAGRATMDVSAAREMRVCRICREPMDTALGPKGALIFDFGREYAHEKCLVGVQSPPTEARAKCPTCANLPPDQRRFASCPASRAGGEATAAFPEECLKLLTAHGLGVVQLMEMIDAAKPVMALVQTMIKHNGVMVIRDGMLQVLVPSDALALGKEGGANP